ncbi:hypothetical protein MPTK1_1g12280 [Marchantia polymorpha subsp. ruderalis]|uniref:Uncharacterized protein n=2 Tax=Marchantia polymorpha TaxID=3197 RepID=A0AAF6APB7_MARPO|nr:hypothetical protein MARPO_3439s0001 [Marchantia polymorpha]BBM98287.1 hypothetical protein Mp_1g12280 [Marchantia polymorpha subsp. ruderalis]|eukprot:PTQ26283.1 hypothetical protein MARPO_3439s0001 [Marchantia polymorpha]
MYVPDCFPRRRNLIWNGDGWSPLCMDLSKGERRVKATAGRSILSFMWVCLSDLRLRQEWKEGALEERDDEVITSHRHIRNTNAEASRSDSTRRAQQEGTLHDC